MTENPVRSVSQLYDIILSRSSIPLPGLESDLHEKALKRARKIHLYLLDREDRLCDKKCLMCGRTARGFQTRHAYETPWDDKPAIKYFCSDDCGDSYMYEEPYAYFWCDGCDREVCEQNPSNGWHIQYREYEGDQVCLRCYKEIILENGVERDKIEKGKIPGMFFDWGNTEAEEAGYRAVPGFSNYLVDTQDRADDFRKKALELMDEGSKVVIAYESLAIGGSEGYVTLMVKRGGGSQWLLAELVTTALD